jgi:hypothetical protein
MPSRVTLAQIVENITQLSAAVKPAEFIYDFLTCFGAPKATIARLKGGALNVAKKEGCTLLKTKVYFEPLRADLLKAATPMHAIEAAQKDSRIAANKPRFLIATDFKTLAAFDTKRRDTVKFPIGDLHEHYTFFLPLAGMEKSTVHAEAEADVKAAENMAKLYDLIRADNPPKTREERHALNVFLTRLLFCYFAEDTDIFPDKSFTGAVESYTQTDGSDLDGFLQQLFLTLNTEAKARGKTPKHLADFPYVNGGLFSDTHARQSDVPTFSTKSRQKLIELGTKSWQEINPDIFGSMFQGVVDDEKRAELGMHYTSVPNIMKVIRPLFLDDLYAELEKAKGSEAKLNKLLSRIYRLRIFDPACGSGNFLIIAYKELRRLEMAVFQELQRMAVQLPLSLSGIQVSQFYGIELDDFAHEVAILALWLAEHQMNIEFEAVFGKAPASLPLKDGAKIVCGNATQLDWAKVCPIEAGYEVFITGNPPYAGSKLQSADQKRDIRDCLSKLGQYKDLDYIACWFVKASDYIQGNGSRYAFVTTNSLNQGVQVELLWTYVFALKQEIFFAVKNFRWQNNAKNKATVTCSIIGLRNPSTAPKKLYAGDVAVEVAQIGPYLIAGTLTIIGRRTEPISAFPKMDMGNQKFDNGHLVLSTEQRAALIEKHSAISRFIRPLIGTTEFIESSMRYCFWISDSDVSDAKKFPEIANAIKAVAEYRSGSTDAGTRKLAGRPHQFRDTNVAQARSLLVSRTSSENRRYIPCGFLDKDVIIADAQAVYDAELWVFSIASSRLHYLWAKTVGGGLETRIRYSSTICYNNFPFPEISAPQKKELERLAELVLIEREKYPEKTIAWLYDPESMPDALLAAHQKLDEAVERCYRTKPFASDEERLEYIFTRYDQMVAPQAGELFAPPAPTKAKAKTKKS